jgi:hypothetical protein
LLPAFSADLQDMGQSIDLARHAIDVATTSDNTTALRTCYVANRCGACSEIQRLIKENI